MKRSSLICPACQSSFHHREKRSWFIKHVLFYLPFKVYFCERCSKDVYILFRDHQQSEQTAA
nr:hypothetical protein [uncultured Mucilaginibacter sp.]